MSSQASVASIFWIIVILTGVMAPHSRTLAWRIPWMEEPGRLQSMGRQESDTIEQLRSHFSLSCIGEGNGNPLQCSFLENPRDRGAWWAAVYEVAQSRTWLTRLSSSSNRCEVISCFWFAFPWWLVMLSIFSYACWLFLCPRWKNV